MGPQRQLSALRNRLVAAAVIASVLLSPSLACRARPVQADRASALPSGAARRDPRALDLPRRAAARAAPDSTGFATVACSIIDARTRTPLSVRASVLDRYDEFRYPLPASSCFYHWPTEKCVGYFYADGGFSLEIPLGKVILGLGHGFEYTTVTDTLFVVRDTSLVYALEQWIDMSDSGWFCGDCHLHMNHGGGVYDLTPDDMWFMGHAEGLNVINAMDGPFLGEPDPVSTPDCILYVSEEQRGLVYGHCGLMGLSSLYEPAFSTWWPLLMDVAREVHSQSGAAVVPVHPANNASFFDLESIAGRMKARELPLDVIARRIDGLEVLSSGFLAPEGEIHLWHRLLNCGFRLPPTAGSDATMSKTVGWPLGCFKSYVRMNPDEYDFWHWLKELFRAETFVTNGPLITTFCLGHLTAGDAAEIVAEPPVTYDGHLSVSCTFPLRRADIVRNGETIKSFFFGSNQCSMDTTFTISIDESSWIGARVVGDNDCWFTLEDSLFAHTGPIYLELNGAHILETDDAAYFLQWVDDLKRLVDSKGQWSSPAESLHVFAKIAEARQHYEALALGIDTGAPEAAEPARRALRARPNPFAEEAAIRFALPAPSHATLRVYTASGRLVQTVADRWFAPGEHAVTWDGRDSTGREVGSGIYLCRLDAGSAVSTAKLVLLR